jgi:hypothetical protein
LLDLFVANGSTTRPPFDPPATSELYRTRGDGTFEPVGARAGVARSAWSNGVAAADFDGDGDTDLFVTNWGPHFLYASDGAGRFDEVAERAGVSCAVDGGPPLWGAGAAWADVDLDGDLDLYVAHYLEFDPARPPNGGKTHDWKGIRDAYYGPPGCVPQADAFFQNDGDGTFTAALVESGLGDVSPAFALVPLFTDRDLDGDADLYVANDTQRNYLFDNDGTGRFEERGALLGVAYGEQGNAQAGMGVAAADFDGDGDDELFVTNFDDDVNTLYRNDGRSFRDISAATGLSATSRNVLSWGCALADLDLDGDRDLFVANGHVYPRAETDDPRTSYRQPNQVYESRGGRLVDVSSEAGPGLSVREASRGVAIGDFDADGDVDAFVVNLNARPTLLVNESERAGHWLAVRLQGAGANTEAIGARVTVRAGDLLLSAERRAGGSFLSTDSPWLHFGLGPRARVDEIRVRWPGGAESAHGPFDADSRLTLAEPR